jgi:hypothetical protein
MAGTPQQPLLPLPEFRSCEVRWRFSMRTPGAGRACLSRTRVRRLYVDHCRGAGGSVHAAPINYQFELERSTATTST